MNGLAFFDTNVLVYADDISSPEKREVAIALFAECLRRRTAVVSLQVLQEDFAAATRKLKVAPEVAQRKVEVLAHSRVVRFDVGDVIAAIEMHRSAGATILYTEDLRPGAVLGGVQVVNPFLA